MQHEDLYETVRVETVEIQSDSGHEVVQSRRFRLPQSASWETYYERVIANDHASLAELVTTLGGFVPRHLLKYLEGSQVEWIEDMTAPLNPDVVLLYSDQLPDSRLRDVIRTNANHLPRKGQVEIADATPDEIRFSDLVQDYLNSKTEASKERSQRLKACQRVLEYCGDHPLVFYTRLHAYDIAKAMHEAKFSRSQISKTITYGRGLFKYATKNRGANGEALLINQPWTDIELYGYGWETRKYKPFDEAELSRLFALDMGEQERLLLTILVTTGMRLDEVALLTWERVREYKGITCFCLVNDTGDERFKNRGSMRYIPVPKRDNDPVILSNRNNYTPILRWGRLSLLHHHALPTPAPFTSQSKTYNSLAGMRGPPAPYT